MNKLLKSILGWLIILLPLLIALGFIFNHLSKSSFYENEGSLKLQGLSSQVKIYSDDYGVPHILGSNDDDIYFALGYIHAQNRLWQMDLSRRVAEGKLSEIFGSKTIDIDKLFRTIGIDKFSYRWFTSITPKSKQILTAYSNGVNLFIEIHKNNLPVEFDALNYYPELWKPEHSLMLARLMAWDLNINWYTDYVFGEIVNRLGIEKASDIFPDTTFTFYKKTNITSDSTQNDSIPNNSNNPISKVQTEKNFAHVSNLASDFFQTNNTYRKFFGINASHVGSNSWVISGEKSESGKPLLANDPHLAFLAPSKWFEVHLQSGTLDVSGMSIPGMPAVVIGHNRFIAWGMTNLMNDDNDFVILNRDSSDLSKYRFRNQTFAFDSTSEKIYVKDSSEVSFTVLQTKIGPVISNLEKRSFADGKQIHRKKQFFGEKILTFKWTGYEYSDEINCFYKLNSAGNWEEFRNSLKEFNAPAMNFTYADVNNNIGYNAAGKIPIRKVSNEQHLIIPAGDELEWTGFIDFERLPSKFNPKEGYIVTANTNPFEWLGNDSKNSFYISYSWEPASRFNRIKEMLNARSKFNLSDFRLLQMDYQSTYARDLSVYIVDAFKNFISNNEEVAKSVELFKNWNGEMKSNQTVASIYNFFLVALIQNIFKDELGDEVFFDFLIVQNLPYRSIELLLRENDSDWFDDVHTSNKETRDEIIRKSLIQALEVLKEKFKGKVIDEWHWGLVHQLKFVHPFGMITAFDKTFNIGPFEVGGDQTTVNNSEYSFNDALNNVDFKNILGPSMRILIDMNDALHMHSVNTTGQSGQPLHPNFSDQARLWLYGDYKIGVMDETEMLLNNYKLLILNP